MKVAVAGSVGGDHIMSFGGKFTDSLVAGSLAKVSLSFLVDTLEIRRGVEWSFFNFILSIRFDA